MIIPEKSEYDKISKRQDRLTLTKLSLIKKVCSHRTLNALSKIYKDNKLEYTLKNYQNKKEIDSLIDYLKNDKKNNDDKVNFILLKRIGKTTMPNKYKISINQLKKDVKHFTRY